MSLLAVPPRESMEPRRKQKFYDFAVETFEYGSEILAFKQTQEFFDLSEDEKELRNLEIKIIQSLNELQVSEIQNY